MHARAPGRPEIKAMKNELLEVYAETRYQQTEIQKLLGRLVIWETTVLKPLAAQLQH